MSLTSGTVSSSELIFNQSDVSLRITVNGNAMLGYQQNFRVFNPAGFFSVPMPGRMVLVTPTPYGNTGYTMGFANEAPDTNNNISDLVAGESAICETSSFNFNIKAKINKLLSTFKNVDNQVINTTIPIGENIVTILTDIIAEIVDLEANYNALITTFNNFNATFMAHVHSGVSTGSGLSGGTTTNFPNNPSYNATSNFNDDNTFINRSPSGMYINLNGVLLTHPL